MNFERIVEELANDEESLITLFLGPELNINKEGVSYKTYFTELVRNKNSVKYCASENVFLYDEIDQHKLTDLKEEIEEAYTNFYKEVGDKSLYELISNIKFPLVVNVGPDRTLNELYKLKGDKKGVEYDSDYRITTAEQGLQYRNIYDSPIKKPTSCKPFIFNIFGDINVTTSLITNHSAFYKSIANLMQRESSIPKEIENYIRNSSILIFLGFDFESWQYQLLCERFGFKVNDATKRYNSDNQSNQDAIMRKVLPNTFKINYVNYTPLQIMEEILKESERKNFNDLILRSQATKIHKEIFISYAWDGNSIPVVEILIKLMKQDLPINFDKLFDEVNGIVKHFNKEVASVEVLKSLLSKGHPNLNEVEKWYNEIPELENGRQVSRAENYSREAVVNEIVRQFKELDSEAKVIRDKNEMTYGDNIDTFMSRIGNGKAIIRVISDKYLKSKFCMDEAFRINKNKGNAQIFNIILSDIKKSETAGNIDTIYYKEHWGKVINNIYSIIEKQNVDTIQKAIMKRDYNIYLDIYSFINQFLYEVGLTVNLNLPYEGDNTNNIQLAEKNVLVDPVEEFDAKTKAKLANFVKEVNTNL